MVQDLKTRASSGARTVLVTGANGFVGTPLCDALAHQGWTVRRALRNKDSNNTNFDDAVIGDIGPHTDWHAAVTGVDTVIHLAARTHVMHETTGDPVAEYRRVNVDGTLPLAQAARAANVRRFIFLSSIKVNGEATTSTPYSESDEPRPADAYGVSKREAELALQAAAGSMETVVLRPPLLYGPGVKGNFLRLMRAIERGIPLPLASLDNRRSLLNVNNLVDAISVCIDHPAAAGQTYLLADEVAVSTPELARAIAAAMDRPARLIALAPGLLKFAGAMTGRRASIARLTGSLQISTDKIRRELAWRPRYTLALGLADTARWYYRQLAGDTRT